MPDTLIGRRLRVMVAGDSVGWSLGWALPRGVLPELELHDRAIIGCGVMPPETIFVVGGKPGNGYPPHCPDVAEAERRGLELEPDVVLLWLGAWEVYDHLIDGRTLTLGSPEYTEMLEARLQARIDQYRDAGAVTVMNLVPCFGDNTDYLGNERKQVERLVWVRERVLAVAERNRGWVRIIDPDPVLCRADGTPVEETDTGYPLRADGAHFDPTSAVWFWEHWLLGQLGLVVEELIS